ncbi:MAG: DUF1178 family protein [Hydrogenophaga sp.]|nr:DUF1178 family protein [Hydrogenophaga sp.]
MKVLNLQCAHRHDFEGWFASEHDYLSQLARGLVSCPVCGDAQIQKMLTAPRLNLRDGRKNAVQPLAASPPGRASAEAGHTVTDPVLQAQLLRAMRQMLANTEDVGGRFADHARAMHHGEMEPRNIRGRTTVKVALELVDEGIDVVPWPALSPLKETLQ